MIFKKVYIEITNICNLKCDFCSPLKRATEFMTVEEFTMIINKIKNYTKGIYLHIKGEPLLHPELEEILSICDSQQIEVNLTTNGTYLNIHQKALLNTRMLKIINISLQSYNFQLNKNEYIENIKNFIKYNDSLANPKIIKLRFWRNENPELNNQLLNEIVNIDNCTSNLLINKYLSISIEKEFIWPSLDNNILINNKKCLGTISQLGILVDGTIVPCCLDSDGIINLGNIFESEIGEILSHPKYLELKNGFQNHKRVHQLCQKCDFYKR